MRVWSLGLEDSLEEEMATHSSILAWRIPMAEEVGGLGRKESDTTEGLSTQAHTLNKFSIIERYPCNFLS